MPTPGEHKTVQARILAYAEAIGWTLVSREEAEARRATRNEELRIQNGSLFFDDLLDAKVREFNPRYAESAGALLGQFRHLHTDICGNREFVEHLRNRGKFFDQEEKRERDLILIDYDDPSRNVYEVTEEWAFHNGHYGTREDVVFDAPPGRTLRARRSAPVHLAPLGSHQRHPGAGDRVQERQQGRSEHVFFPAVRTQNPAFHRIHRDRESGRRGISLPGSREAP